METRRGQLRLVAISAGDRLRAGVSRSGKAPCGFVVGRLIDLLDEEIARPIGFFCPLLPARQSPESGFEGEVTPPCLSGKQRRALAINAISSTRVEPPVAIDCLIALTAGALRSITLSVLLPSPRHKAIGYGS
jgi:hypothetical protein